MTIFPPAAFFIILPYLLLLLIGCISTVEIDNADRIHELILETMPDVIYEMREEIYIGIERNPEKILSYEKMLEDIAERIFYVNLKIGENYRPRKKKMPTLAIMEAGPKNEEIYGMIKEKQIIAEQVQKLFLFIEMQKQIMKWNKIMKKEENISEEMISKNIKNSMLEEASQQFGIDPNSTAQKQGEWTNIKEIVNILVAQNAEQIEAILLGKGGKIGKKNLNKIGRKLRIAEVAPIQSPYPPRKYGGLERVVSYITEELVRRGHQVTLISASDSVTCAKLVFKWHSLLATNNLDKCNESDKWLIEKALEGTRRGEFDIVHIHTECHWNLVEQIVKEGNAHVAVTLHYLMKSKALSVLGTRYTTIPLISISEDQRQHRPEEVSKEEWRPKFVSTIHHGLPVGLYKFVDSNGQAENLKRMGERPYLVHIGRFSAKKRTDVAIEIASKAGIRLKLAGAIFDEEYWRLVIRPMIVRTNFEHKFREKEKKLLEEEKENFGKIKHEKLKREYRKKVKLMEAAFEEHKKLVEKHIATLKEQRASKNLNLWQYLAQFVQNDHRSQLDKFQDELYEKVAKIVGNDLGSMTGDKTDLVEFVGEIGDEEKKDLLGNAIALLFPIYWTEPFGIVMIESMAFGTPVVSRKIGSVGEVIKPGISGLHFDTIEEGVDAVKAVGGIDRASVRKEFDDNFTVDKMVDEYERVFGKLANGKFDNRQNGDEKRKRERTEAALAG